jgi:hypothetical protein
MNAIEDVDIIINMIVGKAAEEQAVRIGKTLDDVLKKSDACAASAGRMADQYKRAADESAKIRFPNGYPGSGGAPGGGSSGGGPSPNDPPWYRPPGTNPDGTPNYGPRSGPVAPSAPPPPGRGGGRTPTSPLPGGGGGGSLDPRGIDEARAKIDALRAALELLMGSQFVVWLGRIGTLIRGVALLLGGFVGGFVAAAAAIAAVTYAGVKLTQWVKDYINDTKRSNELEQQRLEVRERLIDQAQRLQQIESRRTGREIDVNFSRARLETERLGPGRANQGGSAESIMMNAYRAYQRAQQELANRRNNFTSLREDDPLRSGGAVGIARERLDITRQDLTVQQNMRGELERALEARRQELRVGRESLENQKAIYQQALRIKDIDRQRSTRFGELDPGQQMLSRQAADRLNRGTGDRQDAIYLRDTMGDNDLSRNFFEQNAKSPLGGGMGDLLQQLSTDQAEERKRIADAVTKLNSENFVDTMEEGLAKIAERLQGMPDAIRRAEAPIQRAVDQFIDAIQRLEDRVAKQANALELEEIKRIKGKAGRGGVRG